MPPPDLQRLRRPDCVRHRLKPCVFLERFEPVLSPFLDEGQIRDRFTQTLEACFWKAVGVGFSCSHYRIYRTNGTSVEGQWESS